MTDQLSKLADGIFMSVKGYFARGIEPVMKRLAAIEDRPPATNGTNGKDGTNGVDGKSIDPADIEAMVRRAVEALPKCIDGEPGTNGKDGEPGRDALQIDILPSIDVNRSYPRSTYATWRGGVIRSMRTTDPVVDTIERAGWIVHDDREYEFEIEQVTERCFAVKRTFTSGRVTEKRFSIPVQIYRGVYVENKAYDRGDTVTWAGCQWHCNKDGTAEKPGNSDAWAMSVKRGRDGKDGTLPPTPPATVKL